MATVEGVVPEAGSVPAAPEGCCIVCLGVLQWPGTPGAGEAVAAGVASENRTFETFSLATQLPTAILIRERSVWLHLRNKFPGDLSLIHI